MNIHDNAFEPDHEIDEDYDEFDEYEEVDEDYDEETDDAAFSSGMAPDVPM